MTISVRRLALEPPGWTLETFCMLVVTSIWTSISSFVCFAWIKFLKGWSLILVFIGVPLLTLWSLLVRMLFPFGLASCGVSFSMPHEVNLGSLGVTCNCFDVSSVWLWGLCFLASCLTLLAGNFWRSILEWFIVLETTLSSFRKKTEYISVQDTCSFWWVLGKRYLSLNYIVLLIIRSILLSEACQQVKSGSKFIGVWLVKYSYLEHITSKHKFSSDKHHDTYWSIPKSLLYAMTFWHFFASCNMASLQWRIFSHFSFHLRNLWYKLSVTVQSIFGPLI